MQNIHIRKTCGSLLCTKGSTKIKVHGKEKFMLEKNINFGEVIERKNTNCLKYDFVKERNMPEDVLPLWVADMDFKVSSYIQEQLKKQIEHGIFGYSDSKESYFQAVYSWIKEHYNWEIKEKWIVKTPGIVFALAMAVKAFTNKGDCVLIQQPVYYPFFQVIEKNQRIVINNPLVQVEDGSYNMDMKDFEEKIIQNNVKLFFLCNPHNPVGRVWKKEELEQIGDICYKHNVIVVSDEIHADFIFKGKHQVFANVKKEYEQNSIVCTSPSKTFNLAGLQISNILIPNEELRNKFKQEIEACGYSQPNVMGIIACEAAYKYGNEWYQAMHQYIKENIQFTKEYIEKNIPQIKIKEPEGTYLVWLDFRNLQLSEEQLEDLITNKAKLWLDGGTMFGEDGKGFQRINVACQRATLEKALNQLKDAIDEIK